MQDDPIQGHVIDIIYEVSMPVKKEVDNDDEDDDDKDCEILSVQPAPARLLKNIKVKQEKIEEDMPKKANREEKTVCEQETGTGGEASEDIAGEEEGEEEEKGTPKKGNKRGQKKITETQPKWRNLQSSSKKNKQDQQD